MSRPGPTTRSLRVTFAITPTCCGSATTAAMAGNINDSSAIQALLDRLKSSDAWQRVANASDAAATEAHTSSGSVNNNTASNSESGRTGDTYGDPSHAIPADNNELVKSGTGSSSNIPSVASLLSQLQSSTAFSALAGPSRPHAPRTAISPGSVPSLQTTGPDATESSGNGHGTHQRAPHTPPEALRACTFQQSLPHLARLSEDPGFVQTLAAMRSEQADLERQLWRERGAIQKKHEERVRAARTKAGIIGAGLTQYEADAMTESFRAELAKFDRERVLPAWDGLVTKQQATLEALGVPAMFPTTLDTDRQRQQKIVQVLGEIVGSERSRPTQTSGRDG
ncbi:hypothetical protein GSI_00379 [Ganoderma sinense ZZ0214-1]|uniref:Uncharacterized protein n=1 Tax=Ganoderma sinense ZZ0214-1 TaxID=1077348 RepID=A0A2G8SSF3_9APHY|nr:hypothetical protein GSI_00379 [Ganoderma sinense ZZ0214-1]